MGYWDYYPRYVPVAEKKAKAAKKLKQLRKKNPDIQPVVIEGKALARTWWGKAWNKNLERYADYSNRIGRGRSYVRHGSVLDLKIHSGKIEALVQGGESNPYSITIKIKEIDKKIWKGIRAECEGKLESLSELLMGKFPKDLGEIFTTKGKGLFPSPREIEFSCSCPDWASMCKHVAATLYGVGARLDEDPSLLFKLRKVDVNDLIAQAVEEKTRKLLKKAEKKSARVMDEADLSDVFGIELDEPVKVPVSKKEKPGTKAEKASVKTKTSKKTSKKSSPKAKFEKNLVIKISVVKRASSKAEPEKKTILRKIERKPVEELSVTDAVMGVIRRTRKAFTAAQIVKKTGLSDTQVRNVIYKARKQGKIKNEARGVYAKI
ncbi:hypothetical protein [Desulfonema magnum]|uniref:Zinc finger-containing n=1 Tax=Desulfonema magnum TaxID=45655 RepID=A0A975GKM8_9BACT|nr:hypothetical protein [Desulfonema magnum]QTA84675.1 zinc finger-containing [Desulfonema magnum]